VVVAGLLRSYQNLTQGVVHVLEGAELPPRLAELLQQATAQAQGGAAGECVVALGCALGGMPVSNGLHCMVELVQLVHESRQLHLPR